MKQSYFFSILLIVLFAVLLNGTDQFASGQVISNRDILKAELKVFPNPCRNKLLTVEFLSKEISEIRITNIAGKEIFFSRYPAKQEKTQINLGNQPEGLYMVAVKTTDNNLAVKKLVVASE